MKQRVSRIERGFDLEGIKGFLPQQIFIEDLERGLEFTDSMCANIDVRGLVLNIVGVLL